MPFQKGHTQSVGNKGGGRKGYDWEKEQLKMMRNTTTRFLKLSDKVSKNRAKPREILAFERLQRTMIKIVDKLHASKQHVEHDVPEDTLENLTEFFKVLSKPKKK